MSSSSYICTSRGGNCLMNSMRYQFLFRLIFKALICLSVFWQRVFGQRKLRTQRAIYHQHQGKRLSVSKGEYKIFKPFSVYGTIYFKTQGSWDRKLSLFLREFTGSRRRKVVSFDPTNSFFVFITDVFR